MGERNKDGRNREARYEGVIVMGVALGRIYYQRIPRRKNIETLKKSLRDAR